MTNYNIDFAYDKQNGDIDEKWDISFQHRKLWISFQQLFKIREFNFAGSCLYSQLIVRAVLRDPETLPTNRIPHLINHVIVVWCQWNRRFFFKKKKKKTFLLQLFDIY